MVGDYSQYKRIYSDKTTDINLAATDAGLAGVTAVRNTSYQLFIQKISFNPITAAAQAVIFRDSANTPIGIGTVPASQSTPLVFDFGPKGVALTAGKNLDISNTAGPAAKIHIEAYERPVNAAI